MTPKPRPRKPRDAATLRSIAEELAGESAKLLNLNNESGDCCIRLCAREMAVFSARYLEQARALEKKR